MNINFIKPFLFLKFVTIVSPFSDQNFIKLEGHHKMADVIAVPIPQYPVPSCLPFPFPVYPWQPASECQGLGTCYSSPSLLSTQQHTYSSFYEPRLSLEIDTARFHMYERQKCYVTSDEVWMTSPKASPVEASTRECGMTSPALVLDLSFCCAKRSSTSNESEC